MSTYTTHHSHTAACSMPIIFLFLDRETVEFSLLQCWLLYHVSTGWCIVCQLNWLLVVIHRIRKIPGLFVYGKPEVSVVGFGSHDFNIYRLSDALAACGWNLNALQFPSR